MLDTEEEEILLRVFECDEELTVDDDERLLLTALELLTEDEGTLETVLDACGVEEETTASTEDCDDTTDASTKD